ncbi:MAG: o-succinylbenzoate synthase [Caldisphaera sp.]|jgi:O-succinylbenzoate synthase|nr:o-succinylbenzoate synthase [Caldisphaera sp.]PMP59459.1 MAG: o-succinylbenzoate synthase [Caldisphaera sp.]PMP88964.1 MAG: o-succinylbenzoate synthase [Caldisphaera sp.]
MDIKRIDLYELWVKLKEDFETSFGKTVERPALLIRVEDKSGEEGWAESVAGEGPWYSYETWETAWHILNEFIIPKIINEKDLNTEKYNELVSNIRGHNMAKAGLEMALWDLEAKLNSKPLWKYLGGENKYIVSGVSIGIQKNTGELIKRVGYFLEKGYRRIKIKIKPGYDLEPISKVREEFGYNLPFQVDANSAYKITDMELFRKIDEYKLLMVEQPLHWKDLVDHAELAKHIKTPICLDESIEDVNDARKAYQLGSAMIINIKPGRVGGLSETTKIHDFWYKVANRPVWIGGMLETGIGRGHLVAAATLPGVKYPSDISASDKYYEKDIVDPPWILNKDGTITAPEKPGIGVEVNVDYIEKNSKRTKAYNR